MFSLFRSAFSQIAGFFGFSAFTAAPLSLVLLGLDNSGKTSLQYKLMTGKFLQFAPTQKPKEFDFTVGHNRISAWDLGGHEAVRKAWRNFSITADGIFFLIDANEEGRFQEAKQEFQQLFSENHSEFIDLPIAILANKQDRPDASANNAKIKEILDFSAFGHLKIEYFPCSVMLGTGYQEALQWVIAQKRDK